MPSATPSNGYSQRAIDLSREAINDGGGAFGAVIAIADEMIAEARNETVSRGNPLLHAEIVAVERACAGGHKNDLPSATIYCSCEPCPMCLAAMHYAGIPRVVYSATLDDARARGSGDPPTSSVDLLNLLSLSMKLEESPFRAAAVAVLDEYVRRFGQL